MRPLHEDYPFRFPLALSLLVLSTMARAQQVTCPKFFPVGIPPALLDPNLEQHTMLLCNDADMVLAFGAKHGARWSTEHSTRAPLAAASRTRRGR